MLSLSSCQKDNVKKLSGTQWKSAGLIQPLILELQSDFEVRFYLSDENNHIKEGLREGTYSTIEGGIIFEDDDIFYEDKVTSFATAVTHYSQAGKLVKGQLRVTARTVTVEYDPLNYNVVKSTKTSKSHFIFDKL